MIKFLMNGVNMNRKTIADNQNIIVGFFFVFFLAGLWTLRADLASSTQVILFHCVLLVNTYFSIKCFGRLTPSTAPGQNAIDALLILMYGVLPFALAMPSLYVVLVMLLFLIASFKYTLLLGIISDLRLMKRKITIDLVGVFWNFFIFIFGGFGLISVDALLWLWVGVFFVSNIYLLKIKPMYCLTTP